MPTNTEPQRLSRLRNVLQAANDALRREIAERQRAEEFARRLLEELTHLSRLHIVGEMAAATAHQLNQPLFAIMTHTDVCRRVIRSHAKNAEGMTLDPGAPGRPPEAVRSQCVHAAALLGPCFQEIIPDLEQITAAAEQAAEIIRRLRKMTGKRLARRSSVDLNKLVREAASLLVSDALANNVWLRMDLAPDLPLVLADSVLTQQVILNLARNAIEAMSATGGTALEQWHERELTIRTSAAGRDAVEAAVCDTGPVLPAEIKDRLFEPFFTTKPEGMGLGLSISQAVIQANGGRLLAASNPERGMTFRFTLPVSKETNAMEPDAPPPPHSTHPTQYPK